MEIVAIALVFIVGGILAHWEKIRWEMKHGLGEFLISCVRTLVVIAIVLFIGCLILINL